MASGLKCYFIHILSTPRHPPTPHPPPSYTQLNLQAGFETCMTCLLDLLRASLVLSQQLEELLLSSTLLKIPYKLALYASLQLARHTYNYTRYIYCNLLIIFEEKHQKTTQKAGIMRSIKVSSVVCTSPLAIIF